MRKKCLGPQTMKKRPQAGPTKTVAKGAKTRKLLIKKMGKK